MHYFLPPPRGEVEKFISEFFGWGAQCVRLMQKSTRSMSA